MITLNKPSEALEDYLTADWGYDLCVWPDGAHSLHQSNIRFQGEDPIARITCPGIYQLSESDFTNDFVEWDDDKEAYVVNGPHMEDQGRVVGDLAAIIHECIRDGDVTRFEDELMEKLTADAEEDAAEEVIIE